MKLLDRLKYDAPYRLHYARYLRMKRLHVPQRLRKELPLGVLVEIEREISIQRKKTQTVQIRQEAS